MSTVCIVGCGRVGSTLASRLSRRGFGVIVIDRSAPALRMLAADFGGIAVVGDAAELAVLERAEIDRAALLIAVTDDDNLNAMIAQVAARRFGVERVVARTVEPTRAKLYEKLGIETVSPTALALADLLERVMAREDRAREP
jgi:trk system potassium uptake protein TrkA